MAKPFRAREGQAHHSSTLNHNLYATSRSIITRLTSRSLRGQILRIQVHRHFGFLLHLIWKCRREMCKKWKLLIRREKWIERKFLTNDNIENFYYYFERNALEGLSICVCELGIVPFLEEKVHPCYRRPSFPSQLDEIITPKRYMNLIQERGISFGARVVYKNLPQPSDGIETVDDLPHWPKGLLPPNTCCDFSRCGEPWNVALFFLLRFLFTDEPDTNLWDCHVGAGDASGCLATTQGLSYTPCGGIKPVWKWSMIHAAYLGPWIWGCLCDPTIRRRLTRCCKPYQ